MNITVTNNESLWKACSKPLCKPFKFVYNKPMQCKTINSYQSIQFLSCCLKNNNNINVFLSCDYTSVLVLKGSP